MPNFSALNFHSVYDLKMKHQISDFYNSLRKVARNQDQLDCSVVFVGSLITHGSAATAQSLAVLPTETKARLLLTQHFFCQEYHYFHIKIFILLN